jgi:cyclopropane-fatty-acyl-phospholipid synthase
MKSASTLTSNSSPDTTEGWFTRRVRQATLKQLEQIRIGELVLHDRGRVYRFGTPFENKPSVELDVYDPGFYFDIAFGGSVGAGEAYMRGDWQCSDLTALIRLLLVNREVVDGMDSRFSRITAPINRLLHRLNRNTRRGSRKNIAAHYDLGNDLFRLMLDDSMMYSSAIYEHPDVVLYQASIAKLERICRKLDLQPDDQVLEIGTGWGGFAIYAAQHYGCHVTTTTISRAQYELAKQRVEALDLQDQITLLLEDYRELQGRFDKLVSIEMIEAIGQENLGLYFNSCSRLLKDDGLFLLQAITITDQRYRQALRDVDFIQKYIFPGGSLPCISIMADAIREHSDMRITHLEDIGPHYAQTLRDWRRRFLGQLPEIRKLGYNEQFIRMWEFYLCYCEGGFEERAIGTVQMLMNKPLNRRPAILPTLE